MKIVAMGRCCGEEVISETPCQDSTSNIAASSLNRLNIEARDRAHCRNSVLETSPIADMASKYAFTSGLREVRFHLCHSSPASEAARYASKHSC
jgi:hypothetical protein